MQRTGQATSKPSLAQLLALAAISAAVLALEILLLGLFEFSHWHHFAGLAIALALLGFGAAGTTLALAGKRRLNDDTAFMLAVLATAAGLLLVLALHAFIALRPLFAAWDGSELLKLLLVDFVAFLPFYAAGLAIGMSFARWPQHSGRVYAANLFGSAFGSLAACIALMVMQLETALATLALLIALLGTVLALRRRRKRPVIIAASILLTATAMTIRPPSPSVSDFKALAMLQDLPDSEILAEQPGMEGRLTLLRSQSIRNAPGLSLAWTEATPSQDAIVIGSDRIVPLPRTFSEPAAHAQAALPGLAPAILRPEGRVLVLGSADWQTPLMTPPGNPLRWIEPDQRIATLAADRGAQELVHDGLFRQLVIDESSYAVIAADRAHSTGDAATEDYLLTIAGMRLVLQRLEANGLFAIPLPVEQPPRHYQRLLATLHAALREEGVEIPAEHVAILRGMQSMLLLASPRPLADNDIARIRDFSRQWQFDLAWLPDMDRRDANRFHQLDEPVFHDIANAIFDNSPLPATTRWFHSGSATLDQPYAWRTINWSRLPDFINTLGRNGMSYLDWTLLLSAITTVLVSALALLLIILPLGRLPDIAGPLGRGSVSVYFAALGLAYLLVELAIFQRVILFLDRPVLAAALVFAIFLIGSGIGSMSCPTYRPDAARRKQVTRIFLPVALGLLPATLLWFATPWLLGLSLASRMAVIALLLLPITFAMGRPFPWALQQLAAAERWVPWAWGINGFFSVLAATLAPFISVQAGQSRTLAIGLGCYAIASVVAFQWARRPRPAS